MTNTGVSSGRLYSENKLSFFGPKGVSIPVAVSVFPDELCQAPRSWAEKAYPKLIHYNRLPKGGHFAAWEQPKLLVEELRTPPPLPLPKKRPSGLAQPGARLFVSMPGVREDAPESLRFVVLQTARDLDWRPTPLRGIVCKVLRVRPDLGSWSEYPNIWDEVQGRVYRLRLVQGLRHLTGRQT